MIKWAVKALCILFFSIKGMSVCAQVPVYADTTANDSLKLAITSLFNELGKAGFEKFKLFSLSSYNGTGIAFINAKSSSNSRITVDPSLKKFGPEGIYIKADAKSVIISGNSNLAMQEAVFIYLENLGFRYLLPGKLWAVTPKLNSPYKAFTIVTQPNYEFRNIVNAHAYGTSKTLGQEYESWSIANRLGGSFSIQIGHAYEVIVLGNMEQFKQHPEYFAQSVAKGSIPEIPKFNVANKDLVQLVVNDAVKRVGQFKAQHWNTNMISMEPSDGGGYCTTPACNAIGNATDQTYYLTNAAAKAIQQKYPGSWVGTLAYSEHMLPTKLPLEKNVFVMVTNGFNQTKYSTEELLQLWGKKASRVGIYDYLSVYEWDFDMPGRVYLANIKNQQKNIQQFYKNGARAYSGESVIGWINKGPALYVATKLLWNINDNAEAIRNDFLVNAFGSGAPIMKKLYDSWEEYPNKIPTDNDLADWFQWVNEAYESAGSDIIRQRIAQVKIYLHYIVLYRNLQEKKTEENLLKVMSYAYRTYDNAAFATLPTLVSLPNSSGFPALGFYAKADQPWKQNNQPVTISEINKDFNSDRTLFKKSLPVEKFAIAGSSNFVHLTDVIKLAPTKYDRTPHTYWGQTEFIIKIDKQSANNFIDITSGLAAIPATQKQVKINVFRLGKNGVDDDAIPVLKLTQDQYAGKKMQSLQSLTPGLYSVQVNDEQIMCSIDFSAGIDYSVVMKPSPKLFTSSVAGLNVFYFYVPPGTKRFRLTKTVIIKFLSPKGRFVAFDNNLDQTVDIEIQPGEEGMWQIYYQTGQFYIEGVPPYLGIYPSTMLLPASLKK